MLKLVWNLASSMLQEAIGLKYKRSPKLFCSGGRCCMLRVCKQRVFIVPASHASVININCSTALFIVPARHASVININCSHFASIRVSPLKELFLIARLIVPQKWRLERQLLCFTRWHFSSAYTIQELRRCLYDLGLWWTSPTK